MRLSKVQAGLGFQSARCWQSTGLAVTTIIFSAANFVAPMAADEPPSDLLPPPGGGPRGEICILAPLAPVGTLDLWSDRPLFLWQGRVSRIEVTADGRPVWSALPASGDSSLVYSGPPLQPGQVYRWQVFLNNSPVYSIPFQLLSLEARAAIDAELATLEAQLVEASATPNTVALSRARAFAARQLWADTLRELLSIEHPDAAIEQYIQEISTRLCGQV